MKMIRRDVPNQLIRPGAKVQADVASPVRPPQRVDHYDKADCNNLDPIRFCHFATFVIFQCGFTEFLQKNGTNSPFHRLYCE